MRKKRISILGAGISGLSLAYFLSKRCDLFDITVIEKSGRCGGWIESDLSSGFFFENGPRTFLRSKATEILALAREVGLEDEIIASDPKGGQRYLWTDGKLRKNPIISWGLIRALLTEWRISKGESSDETVYDFACRRFNKVVAEHFFEPLSIGIYAGEMRKLSMAACFPMIKEWETKWGSLTKGFLLEGRKKESGFIALQNGMGSLVKALEAKTKATFLYQEEVKSIRFVGEVGIINEQYEADVIFSALPAHVLGRVLIPELLMLNLRGTTVVNLGYARKVLDRSGFGYIVAAKEQAEVLGVVFNSNIFPQHNRHKEETRLTVKLRRTDLFNAEAIEIALQALKKQLGISIPPNIATVIKAENAFPHMEVGYIEKMRDIEKSVAEKYPRLKLVGNYFCGVGVESCVARARSVAESFLSTASN